jgi:competence protein ComEA
MLLTGLLSVAESPLSHAQDGQALGAGQHSASATLDMAQLTTGDAGSAETMPEAVVDINTASASELAAGLNGVGASRAEAIVRYREQFGPFESIEELAEVSGIGPATVERNRAILRLN